jgi:hypothetical protein
MATPTVLPASPKPSLTSTPNPTVTSQPGATVTVGVTVSSTPDSNLGYWSGLQYDVQTWRSITYDDKEWTPETYPLRTLEPLLKHNFIEGCLIYLEEGRDLPAGWTYREVPVIIGGHVIFDERIFSDENGRELFMVIVGSYHVDYPSNESKADCISDAERVTMTTMRGPCSSGNCGYCPGLPATNLKVGDMVKLVDPQMLLPVTEAGGKITVGDKNDWYVSDGNYNLEVVDGPVCQNGNAWWQLKTGSGMLGWESDNHFLIEP